MPEEDCTKIAVDTALLLHGREALGGGQRLTGRRLFV
jgi:hypothetical protein